MGGVPSSQDRGHVCACVCMACVEGRAQKKENGAAPKIKKDIKTEAKANRKHVLAKIAHNYGAETDCTASPLALSRRKRIITLNFPPKITAKEKKTKRKNSHFLIVAQEAAARIHGEHFLSFKFYRFRYF